MTGENKRVCVTGFGPFSYHKVNDSWNAVNRLKETGLEDELGIELHTREIPVTYQDSEKAVQDIWESLNPCLVIHVGVHNVDSIKLEKLARRTGYCKKDVFQAIIDNNTCPIDGGESISTGIDVENIIDKIVKTDQVVIETSQDAGQYLCEYTYYMSLCRDRFKTLFVHIPPASSQVPIESKVKILRDIISTICTNM